MILKLHKHNMWLTLNENHNVEGAKPETKILKEIFFKKFVTVIQKWQAYCWCWSNITTCKRSNQSIKYYLMNMNRLAKDI